MLQGSLDNFALDEVLGLLSSTNKTGRLELKGDRGTGVVLLQDGELVDATASNTSNGTTPEDVIFELLRYRDGNFIFDRCQVEPVEASIRVGEVLSAAEARLADWRMIEAVVPSLANHVDTVGELPADEVTIDRDEWATLRVIAAGCPASLVCDQLAVGEVEGSRRIKGLAERGLVTVGPPITSSPRPAPAARMAEPIDDPLGETGPPGVAPVGAGLEGGHAVAAFADAAQDRDPVAGGMVRPPTPSVAPFDELEDPVSDGVVNESPVSDEARQAAIHAAAQEKAALAKAILHKAAVDNAKSVVHTADEDPGVEPQRLAEGLRVAPMPDEGVPEPKSQSDGRSGGLLMRYLKAED